MSHATPPLQLCSKCNKMRVPEGGIKLNPTKWYCATCWRGQYRGEKK